MIAPAVHRFAIDAESEHRGSDHERVRRRAPSPLVPQTARTRHIARTEGPPHDQGCDMSHMSHMSRLVDQGTRIRQDHEADPARFRPFLTHDHRGRAGRAGKPAVSCTRTCRELQPDLPRPEPKLPRAAAGPAASRTRTCRELQPDLTRAAPNLARATPDLPRADAGPGASRPGTRREPHLDLPRAPPGPAASHPGHADGTPPGRPVGRERLRRARTPWRPQVRSGERL
jgi:hypothetical protein